MVLPGLHLKPAQHNQCRAQHGDAYKDPKRERVVVLHNVSH